MISYRLNRKFMLIAIGLLVNNSIIALELTREARSSLSALEFSYGDASKGFLTHPIYRAGAVPFEFLVLKTPGNCQRSIQVSIAWDEKQNWVRVRAKGKGVLEQFPSVNRTEGVDFFPNRFSPEPEDFDNGRYLLWIVTSPGLGTWYYDVNTLELIGSEFDLPAPPVPSIPVTIPYFAAIPGPFIQPDENGDIDVVHTYKYDALVRPDLPDEAHTLGAFLPHTLCEADPFRYDRGSARPYLIPQDASRALTWRDYIGNGLIYDMTVEPPEYFTFPPTATNVGVYQGSIAIAGGIPKGWTLDFNAFFGSIAPPIEPLPTAPFPGEQCTDWFKPQKHAQINICQGPPPGASSAGGGS